MKLQDISGTVETKQKPIVASPIKPVVSSELNEAVREIKTIIKSNIRQHPYHKTIRLEIKNDELHRLNSLLKLL
ncbi:MAG: hypothetical protein JKY62_16965 [Desulfocapsa sp.]|nr:hypothetical protein [Desulfocapsa sp.]